MTDKPQPFKDLFVLDLAWVVAGPAATRVLADFGANIVRVESATRVCTSRFIGPFPEGKFSTQHSACYDEVNVGKRSLALDLNQPEARAIVLEMARKADIVVESFSPGQMKRWGLDYPNLVQDNPGLIMLSTSLMGQSGPYSGFAGYGNVGAAVGGFQTLVGHPGELPVGPFGPYTDFVGPRYGLTLLLAALEHRRRTGEGCYIDLAQADAGIQFLAPQVADYAATGRVAALKGNRRDEQSPHGVFSCRDHRWVAIVAETDAQWQRLAEILGGEALGEEFATLEGRKQNEDRLEALVEAWTSPRTVDEVEEALQAVAVPVHRAVTSEDAVADPQFLHSGHFVTLTRSDGTPSVVEASKLRLSDTPPRTERVAPFLGADTDEVLAEILGYDSERIAALRAEGVLN